MSEEIDSKVADLSGDWSEYPCEVLIAGDNDEVLGIIMKCFGDSSDVFSYVIDTQIDVVIAGPADECADMLKGRINQIIHDYSIERESSEAIKRFCPYCGSKLCHPRSGDPYCDECDCDDGSESNLKQQLAAANMELEKAKEDQMAFAVHFLVVSKQLKIAVLFNEKLVADDPDLKGIATWVGAARKALDRSHYALQTFAPGLKDYWRTKEANQLDIVNSENETLRRLLSEIVAEADAFVAKHGETVFETWRSEAKKVLAAHENKEA